MSLYVDVCVYVCVCSVCMYIGEHRYGPHSLVKSICVSLPRHYPLSLLSPAATIPQVSREERRATPMSHALTRVANLAARNVSWKLSSAGLTLTSMRVLELPPER